MKLRHIAIALLAAFLLPAQAFAQNLWQNVSGGMSVADVRAAQPAAIPVAKSEALANGATDDLQIPELQFHGVPFLVRFFFLEGKLVQVNLTANGRAAHADYERLVGVLRTQFGSEKSGGKTAIGQQTRWENAEGLNVSINYLTELGYRLHLAFQVRSPA